MVGNGIGHHRNPATPQPYPESRYSTLALGRPAQSGPQFATPTARRPKAMTLGNQTMCGESIGEINLIEIENIFWGVAFLAKVSGGRVRDLSGPPIARMIARTQINRTRSPQPWNKLQSPQHHKVFASFRSGPGLIYLVDTILYLRPKRLACFLLCTTSSSFLLARYCLYFYKYICPPFSP